MRYSDLRHVASAVIIALVLSACSQPAGSGLTALPYNEDFSNPDGPNGKFQTVSEADPAAYVKYDGGKLRIVVKVQNQTQWTLASKQFGDAVIEVDAQPNPGGPTDNGFGIIFRVKDRKNFYHFEISSDGYWRAGMMKDNAWQTWADWAQHPAIKADGSVNRLKVLMKGDTLEFYVNGTLVNSRKDSTFVIGDIGLMALAQLDHPGTDVSFDNLSVTAPPANAGTPQP